VLLETFSTACSDSWRVAFVVVRVKPLAGSAR
jgi:hypothetical protein